MNKIVSLLLFCVLTIGIYNVYNLFNNQFEHLNKRIEETQNEYEEEISELKTKTDFAKKNIEIISKETILADVIRNEEIITKESDSIIMVGSIAMSMSSPDIINYKSEIKYLDFTRNYSTFQTYSDLKNKEKTESYLYTISATKNGAKFNFLGLTNELTSYDYSLIYDIIK